MTTILALDASSDACSVALLHHGLVDERFSVAPREHTRHLLPMVDELLRDHGLTLADLDAIAYGRGPGSFTGLRICLGVAQGLAFGADKPLVPVSTLEAMALSCIEQYGIAGGTSVVVALDARMGEIYWAEYTCAGAMPQALTAEYVMAPALLAAARAEAPAAAGNCIAVGEGWHYPELASVARAATYAAVSPRASAMVRLAEPLWRSGATVAAEAAEPVYLRDSVAWQKRVRIRQT